MASRFRLYLDESGHDSYTQIDDPNRRYLALLGVWFPRSSDYGNFAESMDRMKHDVFGRNDIVLHRWDIINRKGPFAVLRESDKRRRFDDGLCRLVGDSGYKLVCVVIDKKVHRDRYAAPKQPYHYCLEAMLDRYCGWLNYVASVGDVAAEARGKREDRALMAAYQEVFENGTMMFPYPNCTMHRKTLTSREIKIKPKKDNIHGLQLADLLAHPVKQDCLIETGCWEDTPRPFARQLLAACSDKFNQNRYQRKLWGYGKVLLSI